MRRRPSTSPTASSHGLAAPMHPEDKQPQQPRTYPIILDTMKNDRPLPPSQPPPQVPPGPSDSILHPGAKGGEKPMIIQPPLPPQHVYAPMPALGALSIGFLNKKKEKKEDADFRLITNGTMVLCLTVCTKNYGISFVEISG